MSNAFRVGVALLLACATPAPEPADGTWFEMAPANRGTERYSAWFGDDDGERLYFGLSAFWSASWAAGDDPMADLAEPGDHLIGRFDLASERFLEPLRVRAAGPEVRSSVWDVLAHSNGRIYYTTYFEETGSIASDGSDPRVFDEIGPGLNELYEGPGGNVYATRYSSEPLDPSPEAYGSVVVLTPEGRLVRELRIPAPNGGLAAAKSLAVDPETGEIWLNTDTFASSGAISHETLRLGPDGALLERRGGDPELHFVAFDAAGRGWFAESEAGALRVRVVKDGRSRSLELGPRPALDFVQDIRFAPDGSAVLARWSGVIHVIRERAGAFERTDLRGALPRPCDVTGGPSLLYSAVLFGDAVYGTVYCGARVVRVPLDQ